MTDQDIRASTEGLLNAQSSHTQYSAVPERQREGEPASENQHPNDETLPERLPDTFAEFMAEGDERASPTKFFAGLFKKAGDTLESSLHQAQQTGTDALSTAQNAGSSAFSAVTGIVQDIGNGLAEQNLLPSSAGLSSSAGLPSITRQLKALRLPSPPLMFLSPTATVCRDSICAVPPTGKIVEYPIASGKRVAEVSKAICAAFLPNSQIIVGLNNGGLHVLSVTATAVDHVHDSMVEDSHATVLSAGDNVVAVGTQHGHTKVLNIADLSLVKTVTPPNLCAVQLGAALKHAPVSCLAVSKDAFLLVGYDDGAVKFRSIGDDLLQISFVAHSQRVSGALLFYDVLAITIGNETDPTLAIFDAYTGRCLCRRVLPYAPCSLGRNHFSRGQEDGVICPSELSFTVGGAEGQVELFRVIVLSPEKVELHRVKMLSDRARGKNRAVMQVKYVPEQALLFAVSVSGEVRRWQLSKQDACNMALLDEELSSNPLFTEESVKTAVDQDFSLPDGTRLNSMSAVIKAQTVLAAILETEGIAEHEKDRVATEFQQRQAEMLMATSKEDTELRRARRRIVSRFETGLRANDMTGSVTDQALAKAAKHAAAFEMEFASRRHLENLDRILLSTISDIKNILQAFLKRLPHSVSSELVEIKRDIDGVDQEEADNN